MILDLKEVVPSARFERATLPLDGRPAFTAPPLNYQ